MADDTRSFRHQGEDDSTRKSDEEALRDHETLVRNVKESLGRWTKYEEYRPGRFRTEIDGLELLVLVTEDPFLWIRFHHHVVDVPEEFRSQAIEFANSLHGRSSTVGAHWWLGNESLWQVGALGAAKFDEEVFLNHLFVFAQIADERTEEIKSRLSGNWPSDPA